MALGFAFSWQTQLQLLNGLHELFLALDPRRLIAAATRGGGGVNLGAGGQQAVRQGAAGRRETLGVGAGRKNGSDYFYDQMKRCKVILRKITSLTSCCSLWFPASCQSLFH